MNRNLIIVIIVVLLAILAYNIWGRSAPATVTTTVPAETTQPATTN
jgi:Flp pilus assembly protein CpaB